MKTIFLAFFIAAGFLAQAQTTVTNDYQLLPENLAYFTANRTGKTVSLDWQTLNEQSSKGFTVQRKTNGDWETIGFAPTKAIDGNSSVKVSYAYGDANTFKGITQYRVTEVTADGKQRRSEIRAVKGENQAAKVMLYPNPCFDGRISLVLDNSSAKDIVVVDVSGRLVKQFNSTTSNTVCIENLQPGFYSVCVVDRATRETIVLKAVVERR